jgi:hypothetical protein
MSTSDTTPAVALAHGVFAGTSSRAGVIAGLKAPGIDVAAPPDPPRRGGAGAACLTGFAAAPAPPSWPATPAPAP